VGINELSPLNIELLRKVLVIGTYYDILPIVLVFYCQINRLKRAKIDGDNMMKKTIVPIALFLLLIGLSSYSFAAEGGLALSNKEIIEKLSRLEEGQKGLNKRIDDLGKRIDDQGKRIDDLRSELKGDIADLRSELKGDIADLRSLVYVVLAGIIALIGFVIWDRRTALSPVMRKTKELEERDELTLRALKEYARKEPKMAEVLKSLGVL